MHTRDKIYHCLKRGNVPDMFLGIFLSNGHEILSQNFAFQILWKAGISNSVKVI
jgi:hypothetical protein